MIVDQDVFGTSSLSPRFGHSSDLRSTKVWAPRYQCMHGCTRGTVARAAGRPARVPLAASVAGAGAAAGARRRASVLAARAPPGGASSRSRAPGTERRLREDCDGCQARGGLIY